MAYSEPENVSAGQKSSAAKYVQLVNAIKEIWKYTTTGDVLYASSATTLARLGATAKAVLGWNDAGTALEAKTNIPRVSKRQGGSATDWNTAGTTAYTPANPKIQAGVITMSLGGSDPKGATITFPESFAHAPLVFLTSNIFFIFPTVNAASTTQVTIYVTPGSGEGDVTINWLAIGD